MYKCRQIFKGKQSCNVNSCILQFTDAAVEFFFLSRATLVPVELCRNF